MYCNAPWDGKQHREELWRETHGPVDQAAVEVNIGVQLAAHKVVVSKGSILQQQQKGHPGENRRDSMVSAYTSQL
jgi:hypothetical protein